MLSGGVLPVVLIACGVYFFFAVRGFFVCHPAVFFKTLADSSGGNGVSPVKALSVALAGTLGVGNIAGVATAIISGGPGSVFWMWVSAVAAMSVKYAEVALAVHYRRLDGGRYRGGAMYYIRDGSPHGRLSRFSPFVAAGFALLCLSNALLTGNMVQVNAAADAASPIPPVVIGIAFAVLASVIAFGGARRISSFTVALIPFLSAIYVILSLEIIVSNIGCVPRVLTTIITDAFDFSSAVGGVSGFLVNRAIRFGVTRGIFSNEAGCGTAPTAHASADVRSPHHQGCFGIFEVFVDTILLCTMTAIVILIAVETGSVGGDLSSPSWDGGIGLSVAAYSSLAGRWAGIVISVSVVLFAFATVLSQCYYGTEALAFFTPSRTLRNAYVVLSAAFIVLGSLLSAPFIWQLADLFVGVMTVVNCVCLIRRRRTVVMIYEKGVSNGNRL